MIEEGALESVEAIFSLHTAYRWPTGSVASRSGEFLAGCGAFEAIISGKGGHAALPHDSIDPVLAAAATVISLQNIVSRETDPLDSKVIFFTSGPAFKPVFLHQFLAVRTTYIADLLRMQVVSVSKIHGGNAFNIIPESVIISGTFRAFTKESFNALKQRIKQVPT